MTSAPREEAREPLYVDLDGTLVATDTLWESLCLLLRRHPWRLGALPLWLLQGKAAFKGRIAELVCPDARLLPYRADVVERLQAEKAAGRRIILATATHERVAHAIAAELDVFDGVLATSGVRNLLGAEKLAAIREHNGEGPFDYLGDSRADLAVWPGARQAWVMHPSEGLLRAVKGLGIPYEILAEQAGPGVSSPTTALLRALRPHQWAKNLLLFAPIVLAQQLGDLSRLLAVGLGFIAFCAVASAGYLINDLLDIETDRRHATKRRRPFAAGALSIPAGLVASVGLLALAFSLAGLGVSIGFAGMLAAYLVATLSYSLFLKEHLFLDVLVLAGLYTHRVLSGGVAAGVEVSTWLLAFSVFFFLSLALVKRYVELLGQVDPGAPARFEVQEGSRRAYQVVDTGLVETMGIASGYLSVLVLGLYVSRDDVTVYYARPEVLWLIMPLMLYWISRVWLLARRGQLADDPVLFAATDRISYGIVTAIGAIGLLAAMWGR